MENFKKCWNQNITFRPVYTSENLPAVYEGVKVKVKDAFQKAERVAKTKDGCTPWATQSDITVTAHIINCQWLMMSFVLQMCAMFE